MLAMDWNSLMIQFNAKFGADLCEEDPPAQSYFEEFEERLAEGNFEAQRVSEVVSQEEPDTQRRSKADPARQYGMHLDGRLTLCKPADVSRGRNLVTLNSSERNTLQWKTSGCWRRCASREGPTF